MTLPRFDAVDFDAPFVHVGRLDTDPTLRYLTRLDAPVTAGLLLADETAVLAVPPDAVDGWPDGGVHETTSPVGRAVADALADRRDGGRVLTPAAIPHDAALYLEEAGFELASTTLVDDARVAKTDVEADRVAAARRAAARGVDRAAEILATATPEAGSLSWTDAPLSVERLRRQVAAAVAVHGATPRVHVAVGRGDDDPNTTLVPGRTVTVDVTAREPSGYHGRCARTLSVGGDGGWERRAQLAVESALRAALDAAEPGEPIHPVGTELRAELGAFGFESPCPDPGGGVGLAPRERPTLDGDESLTPGTTVVVAPGVRSEDGQVRLAETLRVTDEEIRTLASRPTALDPSAYLD